MNLPSIFSAHEQLRRRSTFPSGYGTVVGKNSSWNGGRTSDQELIGGELPYSVITRGCFWKSGWVGGGENQKPVWRNGRRNGLKIRWGAIPVWVRVPPPVPFIENQALNPFRLPENAPSFNKSFNTFPRVSLVLNASHHAIKRGDGGRSLRAVAMVIPQLEGVPRCSFQA